MSSIQFACLKDIGKEAFIMVLAASMSLRERISVRDCRG
jgi:hypothetical protein